MVLIRKLILNKILNQNAEISYNLLPNESLSIDGREDVNKFKDFIELYYKNGKVLDVGCGPLEWPSYLPINIRTAIGIDPSPSKFKGKFIQTTVEGMPFEDNCFDSVVCATSLDHVFDLEKALSEISRTLKNNGRFLLWCNKKLSLKTKIGVQIKKYRNYISPYYWECSNGYVFEVPRGAVDPFHVEYLNPNKIEKILKHHRISKKIDLLFENNLFMMFEKEVI